MEKNYWIELIGFDRDDIEGSVKNFIDKQPNRIERISLLFFDIDFVNDHKGMKQEYYLKRMECSYNGHKYNNERELQRWTNFQVRQLINTFHKYNVEVFFSLFNMAVGVGEDGEITSTSTAINYPEVMEFSSKSYAVCPGSVNVLKRFASGEYFEDFFVKNLKTTVMDYGFDGVQIADGISSGRLRIVNGDFSDDMVEQFVSMTRIELPQNLKLKTTDNKKGHIERYEYIINNLRYEWTEFCAKRFGILFRKIVSALHSVGKKCYFNNTWTCSPFDSYYRYGVDYREIAKSGIDGMICEDCGGTLTLLSYKDLGVQQVDEEWRKYSQMRFRITQMSLKLATDLKIVNMTTLQDTEEQWEFVLNDYNEFRTMMARRAISVYVDKDGEYKCACQGSLYCLSDGIDKANWDSVHNTEARFLIDNIESSLGFTAVFVEDYKKETKKFMTNKEYYSDAIYHDLINCGLSITEMVSENNINKIKSPFVVFVDAIDEKNLKELEKIDDVLFVTLGYKNLLKKRANATFTCGDFCASVYNSKGRAEKVFKHYKSVENDSKYVGEELWTVPLKRDQLPKSFFNSLIGFIENENVIPCSLYPKKAMGKPKQAIKDGGTPIFPMKEFIDKENCRLFCYRTAKNKMLLYVFNMENHYISPYIKLPFKFKSVKMLGKPDWHKVGVLQNEIISLKITQRNVEVLEFTI